MEAQLVVLIKFRTMISKYNSQINVDRRFIEPSFNEQSKPSVRCKQVDYQSSASRTLDFMAEIRTQCTTEMNSLVFSNLIDFFPIQSKEIVLKLQIFLSGLYILNTGCSKKTATFQDAGI